MARAAVPDTRPDGTQTLMTNLARRPLPDNPTEVRMSFGDHLEELRACLIRALLGVAAGTAVCIYFGDWILGFLTQPFIAAMEARGFRPEMTNIDPTESFTQYFKTCIIFGIGLSAPWGLYQLWQFIAAGLFPHERRWVRVFAPAVLGLFAAGVIFLVKVVLPGVLYFLIATADWIPSVPLHEPAASMPVVTASASRPAALPILDHPPAAPADGAAWISAADGTLNWVVGGKVFRLAGSERAPESLVRPQYSLQLYLDFVNNMCLAFGLGFQIPIVVVLLVMMRIVSAAQLGKLRRFIVVAIFVAAALLTPSGDPGSQLLLAVPMFLLFEIGLFFARRVERKRIAA